MNCLHIARQIKIREAIAVCLEVTAEEPNGLEFVGLFGTIPPPQPSPTRGEGETRLPPPPGGREKQGSLPRKGGGRNNAPSPTRGQGETRLPPPPGGRENHFPHPNPPPQGGREKQRTLPHKGGGRNNAPSPTRGQGETRLPPPLWGRVGVGGKGKNVQSPRAQYTPPVEQPGGSHPPLARAQPGDSHPPLARVQLGGSHPPLAYVCVHLYCIRCTPGLSPIGCVPRPWHSSDGSLQ
jgi:hypothetical protein